ncbi:MAG: ATP-binding cassette, subfamily multidrug efflux pump [Patescibacteria group bacterium]|nr:ATP-binding cassette, subfamily multidrug efflux pump [Patescibacteria group bacterium]
MEKRKPTAISKGGPMGMRMGGTPQKAKHFKKTMLTILGYMKPYWGYLVLVVVCAVVSTAFAIASPKILGHMTDEIIKGLMGRKGINFDAVAGIGIWLICLYILSAVFSYVQGWIMTNISQKITYAFRKDVSKKISKLPLRYFDKHENGDIVSRVTNDIETISQNLNQSMTQIVTAIITIIGILCMMISISWQLTIIAILVLPISMAFISLVVKRSQKYYDKQQSALGEIDGHVDEMFSNHVIVKTFNGEKQSIDEFNRINTKLYESGWKSQFLSGLMMPIMHFISNLGYVGVAVVGGWLAINGKISVGDIQAFIQYMNQFTQPISQTANIANILQATAAAAERVFEFLNEKEESVETDKLSVPKIIKGEVDFKEVNFGYDIDRPIIKDFTIHIQPRQNVAIVGPTGAGKTTIVNLLMRFYDIDSGSISIDNIDIKDMHRNDVRGLFGMVLQDTWLFYGTIADNIAYGKPNATKKEIVAAAKAAYADHFISTLPDGYDTIISGTSDSISAGEKQLLTIARAILADAPMLILDEATSSVDTRTEALIQSAMDKLSHGRTSFVIAHRLSTIKSADVILVMKDGNIIEHGNHDDLMAKKGYYAELYSSQFSVV